MIELYINNVKQDIVNGTICPSFTDTKDLTLQTFQCEIAFNNDPNPIKPKQPAYLKIGDERIADLITWSDEVSIVNIEEKKYKHKLTLTERKKILEDIIPRNIVLSQPPTRLKRGYYSMLSYMWYEVESGEDPWATFSLVDDFSKTYNTSVYIEEFDTTKTLSVDLETYVLSEVSGQRIKPSPIINPNDNFQIDVFKNNSVVRTINVSMADISSFGTYHFEIPLNDFGNSEIKLRVANNNQWIRHFIDGLGRRHSTTWDWSFKSVALRLTYQVSSEGNQTMYQVLTKIRDIAKKTTNGHDYGFIFNIASSGELYELLNHTIAPNFTFTQATLYQILQDIFNYYDATFTLDENNNIGIRYLNENTERVIDESGLCGFSALHEGSQYSNGMLTFFENTETKLYYPSEHAFTRIRNVELGVPSGENSITLQTQKPIQQIDKFYMKLENISVKIRIDYEKVYGGGFSQFYNYIPSTLLFDCVNVFEQSEWNNLGAENTFSVSDSKQVNSIYYTKSSNQITLSMRKTNGVFSYSVLTNFIKTNIATFFGDYTPNIPNEPDYANIYFQVLYTSIIDGRLQIESLTNKGDGVELNNQSSGIVDIHKLGQSMLGLNLKVGEPSKTICFEISDWNDRLQVGDKTEDGYIVNQVSYEFVNDIIRTTAQLTKNFNALSNRIAVDNASRLSNISSNLAQKCEDNIVDYVYFDDKEISGASSGIIDRISVIYSFHSTIGGTSGTNITVTLAYLRTDKISYDCYIPLNVYGTGNSLCFECSFDSPISSGNQTNIDNTSGWYGETKFFTKSLKYTDNEGKFNGVNVFFVAEYQERKFNDFPVVSGFVPSEKRFYLSDYRYYKQPNEIFGVNYQVCYISLCKDIMLGSGFFKNNVLVKESSNIRNKIYSSETPFDIFDNVIRTGDVYRDSVYTSTNTDWSFYIRSLNQTISTNHKHFAVVDNEGNILIAINNISDSIINSGKTIYFSIRNARI